MGDFNNWIITAGLVVILLLYLFVGFKYFRHSKFIKNLYIIVLIILIVVTAYSVIELILPNGRLFSFGENSYAPDNGHTTDESPSSNYIDNDLNKENEEIYIELSEDTGNYGNDAFFVIVKGKELSFQDITFETVEDFEEYFRKVNFSGKVLYIVDCYADSAVMHAVLDIADRYHSDYSLEYR